VSKKKKRAPIILPHFGKHVEIAHLELRDGTFSFYDSNGQRVIPTHAEIGDAYNRESGKPKIINRVQTNGALINLNPNAALKHFDWLFAIDTNTRTHGDSVIAISCSMFAEVTLREPTLRLGVATQDWAAKVVPQAAFVFRNPKVNSELVGWEELINRVRQSAEFVSGRKVGIIVDSELDRIGPINRREIPILGAYYLPDGFELLYASSDVGAEYPHNKLLRICDRTSSRVWDYVSEHPELVDNIEYFENPFIDGSTTLPSTLVYRLSGHI
jgi:hypothetical protein